MNIERKSPAMLDFFFGSGDVTRTHDTPGMKACGDEAPQMPVPKNYEISGLPVRCLCVLGVHGA